jgi:hypothetical protein
MLEKLARTRRSTEKYACLHWMVWVQCMHAIVRLFEPSIAITEDTPPAYITLLHACTVNQPCIYRISSSRDWTLDRSPTRPS